MKNLEFEPRALEDLTWWIRHNRKTALRIMRLVENIQQMPFEGLGKPESLKRNLSGLWSRRIDREHRLVYEVLEDKIRVLACRFHYD